MTKLTNLGFRRGSSFTVINGSASNGGVRSSSENIFRLPMESLLISAEHNIFHGIPYKKIKIALYNTD
jgi:hypothetical protein